ncbi:efflux RND transporter periplasmic adaptor subunit [uncultured Porticoccus sp.]|uniref:efflux RND transporter periplasmic adaptor subunit n=1 Tax=uncultured Porticoccus sp. TaxID=1256050 RepID=UPI00261F0A3B|nr:efflux RND transporter periplasmic adaptor subunit [uncultured Porticoccus sp.]
MKRSTLISIGIAAVVLAIAAVWLGNRWISGTDSSPATGDSPGLQPAYRAGPFKLGIALDPETPRVGKNTFTLVLRNREGEPVNGATIKAVAEMPAMGAMPAMRAPVDMTEVEPGLYRGTFEPSMEGSWPLTLQISKEGMGSTRASFDLATGRKGLQPASGVTALARPGADGADNADELPYRSGPYRLDVSTEPTTPRVGENSLTIILRNAEGEPLDNADIRAVAEMPAMGSMPAMRAPADMRQTGPGRYQGIFDPAMKGSWPLSLAIQAPGMPKRQISFDLATGREGLQLSSGATRTDGGAMAEEAPPGTVTLDARRRQLIGVTTATAQRMELTRSIRAVGQVRYDETRLADISLKFDAWIGELYADYVGAHVEKGKPLFTVYGPELLAAQQEYLELKRRGGSTRTLLAAARKRLTLWDMSEQEIAALERRGDPFDYVTMDAPISGTVVTRNVVEGTAHKAGMTLLRIADLSQLWVEADIYEAELPLVSEGMPVEVTLPYLPERRFEGKVDFIYPTLDGATRTGRVRLTLANPDGVLKPDMYAEVKLKVELGERLAVPEEAVIIAGENRFVFEDLGEGRLAPRRVRTGQSAGSYIEILEGIEPGDRVVTSGNFLIASESRLKAGMEQW